MALQTGIEPSYFWEYSPQEVVDLISAKQKELDTQANEKYVMNYALAQMIAVNVARILSNDVEVLEVWEFASEYLFREES